MAAKLKKGDKVVVIAGGNKLKASRRMKGEKGEITRVIPSEGKAIVAGLNISVHHERQSQNQEGGRRQREQAVDLSNLMLVDPKTGEPTRVGFKFIGEGADRKKVRFAKKSGEVIDG